MRRVFVWALLALPLAACGPASLSVADDYLSAVQAGQTGQAADLMCVDDGFGASEVQSGVQGYEITGDRQIEQDDVTLVAVTAEADINLPGGVLKETVEIWITNPRDARKLLDASTAALAQAGITLDPEDQPQVTGDDPCIMRVHKP